MKLYGVSYSAVFYFLSPYKKSKSQGVKNLDESQGFSFYDKNVKMPYVIQNREYYGLKDFRLVMRV